MKINGVDLSLSSIESLRARVEEKRGGGGPNFSKALTGMLKEVSDLQREAEESITDLVTGKEEDLHSVILAMNRADLSFRYMLEIRNRLVEAYQDIMRMNV